jgi:hypothetical protein
MSYGTFQSNKVDIYSVILDWPFVSISQRFTKKSSKLKCCFSVCLMEPSSPGCTFRGVLKSSLHSDATLRQLVLLGGYQVNPVTAIAGV